MAEQSNAGLPGSVLEPAIKLVRPAVVGAPQQPRVPVCRCHGVQAVPADVDKAPELPVPTTDDDDGDVTRLRQDDVSGLRQLRVMAGVLPRPPEDLLLFELVDLGYRIEQRGKGVTGGKSGEDVCVRGETVPCLDITQRQQLRHPQLPECSAAKLRDAGNLGQPGPGGVWRRLSFNATLAGN